jgi:negative regulator of flagellin synthesis FlgM
MHIHGTTHIHGPHGINGPHFAHRGQGPQAASQSDGADRVEISPAAEEAIRLAETGRIRQELVNSIRAQIAAGTYETPAKLDAALERMFDEIA